MGRVLFYTVIPNQGCHSCYQPFIGPKVTHTVCVHNPLARASLRDPQNKEYGNKGHMWDVWWTPLSLSQCASVVQTIWFYLVPSSKWGLSWRVCTFITNFSTWSIRRRMIVLARIIVPLDSTMNADLCMESVFQFKSCNRRLIYNWIFALMVLYP